MQRIAPEDSAGFNRLDASMAPPDVAPAPITVWISSMNSTAPGILFEFLDDLLQALFEVAAIAGAGEQRAHVEREDRRVLQRFRNLLLDDALGETFGDGRLADAGVADIERVVLRTAAQDLDRAVDLGMAADQRIDLAGLGLLVEVDAIGRQRILLLLRAAFVLLARWLLLGFRLVGTARRCASRRRRGAWRCRAR